MRLKDVSRLNPQYLGLPLDADVSFVPMESLRYDSLLLKEISFADAIGNYTFFAEGDLLLAKVTPCFENGNIAIAKGLLNGIGFGSSEIFVLRMNNQVMPRYMFYYTQTRDFTDAACSTMCGVGGLKRISPLFMRAYEIIIPPLPNQHKIVKYLDEKTALIDRKISLLEKELDAFRRLRSALINRAVTRGLNSEAKMKDSEVDWIGEIPEHWEVISIKRLFYVISGATPKTNDFTLWDGGIKWITPADYKTEDMFVSEGKRTISEKGLNSCGTVIVPKGSIIVSKRAPIGTVAIAKNNLCTNQGCLSCVPRREIDTKYYYYFLSNATKIMNVFGRGTTFTEISTTDFSSFFIPYLPLPEQQSIAAYLDAECAKIDTKSENIRKRIDAYRRLKRALIDEVITGKRTIKEQTICQ